MNKVFTIIDESSAPSKMIFPDMDSLKDYVENAFEDMSVGEEQELIIGCVEMTDEEIAALPEMD